MNPRASATAGPGRTPSAARGARNSDAERGALAHGDPLAESVRFEAAAFSPGNDWARVRVDGPDAADYLHRRLTRDLRNLGESQGLCALELAGDGRLEIRWLLYRLEGGFDAIIEADQAAPAAQALARFVLMDDVTVAGPRANEVAFAVIGPRAAEALRGVGVIIPAATGPSAARWSAAAGGALAGRPCRIYADGRWPEPYFHLFLPAEAAEPARATLAESCRAVGGGLVGADALEVHRIQAGVPRLGVDLTAETIPLEAALEPAIDFEKGCFPGQEVLARIRNLAHPARQLVRLVWPEERTVSPGEGLIAAEAAEDGRVGRVTSAATFPGLGRTVGLGYLDWRWRECRRVGLEREAAAQADVERLAHSIDASATRPRWA